MENNMIWGNLIHLSYNLWADCDISFLGHIYDNDQAMPYLRFDEKLWNDMLKKMVDEGLNMVVIDLGDAVKYESHPEIAVEGAWSVEKLKSELVKIRKMGLEPIPKLNFSTAHDIWLGKYERCVSTDTYYKVCSDLINEVMDIFGNPRFFHLGMDEENFDIERYNKYVVVRQGDIWWHDLYFLVNEVEKRNARAWVWSDYIWNHTDEYLKKMPRTVIQSNWYYGADFNDLIYYVKPYKDLESCAFDQIPTGSNWESQENFGRTVEYCSKNIDKSRLLGFLQTDWKVTKEEFRNLHMNAIELAGKAKREFESKNK